jgi:hypothetical protein
VASSARQASRVGAHRKWAHHVHHRKRVPLAPPRRCHGLIHPLWVTPHAPPAPVRSRSPRGHPWLGAPAPRHAVAVRSPAHRRAARDGDTACSTRCRGLWRLAWSSPPAGSACRPHASGSVACRLLEQPWGSPHAGTACRCHAPYSVSCRLEQPLSTPPSDTACPRHAQRSVACHLQ